MKRLALYTEISFVSVLTALTAAMVFESAISTSKTWLLTKTERVFSCAAITRNGSLIFRYP